MLGQPIGSTILPITHALYRRRYHGQTMISILLLFSSGGANHLENLERHFVAENFDGVAWATLGGHITSAQG